MTEAYLGVLDAVEADTAWTEAPLQRSPRRSVCEPSKESIAPGSSSRPSRRDDHSAPAKCPRRSDRPRPSRPPHSPTRLPGRFPIFRRAPSPDGSTRIACLSNSHLRPDTPAGKRPPAPEPYEGGRLRVRSRLDRLACSAADVEAIDSQFAVREDERLLDLELELRSVFEPSVDHEDAGEAAAVLHRDVPEPVAVVARAR